MHLDKTSIEILKYIKDKHPARIEDIFAFISDKPLAEKCVASLKTKKLIVGLTPVTYHTPDGIQCVTTSPYEITADGLACLENREKEQPHTIKGKMFKWLKDNALEVIAIIISIFALLKP